MNDDRVDAPDPDEDIAPATGADGSMNSPPMPTRFDAVIVGAGPAGSTAAILLARAGWSVALVEKQSFPRRKVCGECISASNLPLLEAIGLGPAFEAVAGPALQRVALMHRERTVSAALPRADNARHVWGRALGRETLDTLLVAQARAAGAVVLQPWSVQALGGGPGAHRCELRASGPPLGGLHAGPGRELHVSDRTPGGAPGRRHGELRAPDRHLVLHAPLVIAAHGSWEPLPDARDQRRRARRPADLFAFKANFRDTALADGLLPVLAFDGGYGGMVVADDGVATLACCLREDRLEACRRKTPGISAGEAVEALLRRECSGVAQALRGARRDGPWLATGPIAPGIRLRPDDTLFRIGNAAGEAHPIIGEGMTMAMQSAWLLCERLVRHGPPRGGPACAAWQREVRRDHAAEWRRRFAPRLRLAAAFAHLAMRPVAASAMVGVLGRWPGLLTLAAQWTGKTRCVLAPDTIARLAAGRVGAGGDDGVGRNGAAYQDMS